MEKRRLSLTLWIYLTKTFLLTVFFTQLTLIGFTFMLDVVELLRKFSDTNIPTITAFGMALLKTPDMALQLAPFALLMGTLLTFSRLTRNYELVALRNAGLPARSFLMPALVVCLAIGAVNLLLFTPLSAAFLKKYEHLHSTYFPGSSKGLVTEGGSLWLKQPEDNRNLFIFARTVEDNGRIMQNATILAFAPDGTFITRQDARRLLLHEGIWVLRDVYEMSPTQEITYAPQTHIETSLTPEMIQNSFTSPRTLSLLELKNFISTLSTTGFNTSEHALVYYQLLASPALLLAMFVLAMPFALHFSRRHGLGWMVLTGLLFGFGFYLFSNMMGAYALTGRLPLWAAAILPPIAATLLGLFFFLHFREE